MTPPIATTDERRPVPAIDPRIRARRIAVRRDRGRRRLHRFTIAAVVAGVAGLLVAAALSPLVDVDRIHVSGAARSGVETVVAASGLERGEPMVTLDAAAAERAVEDLPWVADAEVRRSWPGSVRVDVSEREEAAAVDADEGAVALVDEGGRVLEVVPVEAAGVVVVAGLAPPGPPGTRLPDDALPALAVATALSPTLSAQVGRLLVADGGQLRLELRAPDAGGGEGEVGDGADGQGDAPTVVVLGDTSLLSDKLVALSTLLASVDLTDVAAVDLRVPRAPALTRR